MFAKKFSANCVLTSDNEDILICLRSRKYLLSLATTSTKFAKPFSKLQNSSWKTKKSITSARKIEGMLEEGWGNEAETSFTCTLIVGTKLFNFSSYEHFSDCQIALLRNFNLYPSPSTKISYQILKLSNIYS